MHDNGVIHRDVNPTNIFLQKIDDPKSVKILDFNVSKLIEKKGTKSFSNYEIEDIKVSDDEEESKEVRAEDRFKYSLFTKTGTPLYTAPEMSQAFRYS